MHLIIDFITNLLLVAEKNVILVIYIIDCLKWHIL